ncbi:hypothetical protein MMC28_002700 [Mycoblastus sanguinarius]|nr:hypothetical protein [Mycoblastus sanguinarius]
MAPAILDSPTASKLEKESTSLPADPKMEVKSGLQANGVNHFSTTVPKSGAEVGPHAAIVLSEWDSLSRNTDNKRPVYIDSDDISIASVVAVSKYGAQVELEDISSTINRINQSVEFLSQRLIEGHSLYGVTTGFGGSADLRTNRTEALQQALTQHQHSGILPVAKQAISIHAALRNGGTEFMPETWVRGAMLVRCKSLLNGHSAVRIDIIQLLMELLNHDMIPLVPLRGSVSASGDLQPLSYIAGVLEGNPDCFVWTNDLKGGRVLIPADTALQVLGQGSITFESKEALAVVNGTAVSTAVGALALQEANHLGVFSQVLTAMGVEALLGSMGSFNEFFSKVRPHRGQTEAARNIRGFLLDSKLARCEEEDEECPGGLKQDRYALRTSPQWIGPQLEDLSLAQDQITIESNSTTDNPLVDVEGSTIHHGGNFQNASVTSAMEKTRVSLQMFGRMLFSQCTELINPAMNNGLPPNLAADEPSTSYSMKGADINVAAYMSELAFLANPVSSHVQTAEMGNQAINSLALISARYTHTAIDLLSMICATYLYILCQALDIRAMNLLFLDAIEPAFCNVNSEIWGNILPNADLLESLQNELTKTLLKQIAMTPSMDSKERFQNVTDSIQSTLTTFLYTRGSLPPGFDALSAIRRWNIQTSETLLKLFIQNRQTYFARPDATQHLGAASTRMYSYVRRDLQVPFHQGLADRPGRTNQLKTIGSNISVIYEAMRSGRLYKPVLECLKSDLC